MKTVVYVKIFFFIVGILILFQACVQKPIFPSESDCKRDSYYGVFVLNEGVWGQNNSSLSFWNENESTCEDIFEPVNANPLGDTGNGYILHEDTLYILMSGSGLLHRLSLPSMKKTGEWKAPLGFALQAVARSSAGHIYLTALNPGLKSGKVFEISGGSMETIAEIPVEKYPYGIALYQDKAVVACGNYAGVGEKNRKLAIINTDKRAVEQYVTLPINNPGQVLLHGDTLIVNCRGDYSANSDSNSVLLLINRQNFQVLHSVFLSGSIYRMTKAGNYLYVIRDAGSSPLEMTTIMRMNLTTLETHRDFLPETYFREKKSGDYLYCLSYDEEKAMLYVGFSYSRKGYILNPFHTIVGTFQTGDFPNSIFFYR